MRKMIHVATATYDVMHSLARETGRSFQDLVDEAIADLLKKHNRPVTLKAMLSGSLAASSKDKRRRGA